VLVAAHDVSERLDSRHTQVSNREIRRIMNGSNGSTTVRFETDGPVATIVLDRPAQRNAVDPETSRAMAAAITRLDHEAGIRVGVLTGAGAVFSAGADLKAIAAGRLHEILEQPGGFCGLGVLRRQTPLIAAVNGPALAGGCELALACDIVVADERATFGLPEVTRGIIAGAGGVFRLALTIPPKCAMEALLTGEPITVARAHDLGLVNHVAPAGQALEVATELAGRIATNSPRAVRETRALVELASEGAASSLWEATGDAWQRVQASPDALEGSRAFTERRTPVWADVVS
jgi:enoyl-CoA hydratase